MKKLWNSIDCLIYRCFFLFSLVLSFSLLVIKAMYHYQDYPYFTHWHLLDLFLFLLCLLGMYFLWKHIDRIEQMLSVKWMIAVYLLAAVAFITLLPLKPFSDMQYVSEGAIKLAQFDMAGFKEIAYFKTFKGNIKTSLFYALPLLLLPKTVTSMKLVNVFLLLAIAYLTKRIAVAMQIRYPKVIFMLVLTFLPVFLYIQHIYFELFFICLMLAGIERYLKNPRQLIITAFIFSIAYFLRKNGLILMGAVSVDYLIRYQDDGNRKEKLIPLITALMIFFGTSFIFNRAASAYFYDQGTPSYPKWNQYYIGINEEKFGFMDQSFSYDRSWEDVIERMQEYGPVTLGEILVKKTAWAWGEGTYQSGRYAFGLNAVMGNEKFAYATFLEKYFMLDTQIMRRMITSFSRSQYVVYFLFMTYALWKKQDKQIFRLGAVIFLGTFLALLFYELKSRYVMHCFPFMILFAMIGMESFFKNQLFRPRKRIKG